MRRLSLLALLVLLCAIPVHGQSTTVSGTVTDAGSQAWMNGVFQFVFTPNPQFPTGPYTWTGGNLNRVIAGTLDGSGHYSVSIPSNSAITPVGSTWVLQVTPKASAPSFSTAPISISGGTQTLNVTPAAISITWSLPPGPAISAYSDSEITGTLPPGAEYFNTTTLLTRVWDGSAWKNQGTGGGPPGGGSTIDPTQPPYNVKADGRYQQGSAADGATNSGTPTLTAASLNCAASDVGKLIEAINPINGASAFGFTARAYVGSCASGTVANVVDGSGNPVNATLTGTSLNWAIGTDNTPNGTGGLVAAWLAALTNGQGITMPCGVMLTSAPPFVTQAVQVSSWQSADIGGCLGNSNTMFIGYPTLTQGILTGGLLFYNPPQCSNCVGAAGTGPYPDIHNFKWTGLGVLYPGTSGSFNWGFAALMSHVQIEYMNVTGGLCGSLLSWTAGEAFYDRLNVQGIGQLGGAACSVMVNFAGQGTDILANSVIANDSNAVLFCNGAICDMPDDYVTGVGGGGGDIIGQGNGNAVVNIRGGNYATAGGFTNNLFGTGGSTGTIRLSHVTASAVGSSSVINMGTGAQAFVRDSILTAATAGDSVTGTGVYYDEDGNTDSGVANGTSLIANGHSAKGSCSGVATSSQTLGLFGTGPNVTTTTCTSTTIGAGIVVTGVRTLRNLHVTATAGGAAAGSGVFTVLKNGSSTAITCTVGTGTSCADFTHQVTTADGDRISIQFTTQGTETLAGVNAIVEW